MPGADCDNWNGESEMSTKEQILINAMKNLKAGAKAAIDDVMLDLYTDYLPHVETDTDSNIGFIAQSIVENILLGRFEKTDNGGMLVKDKTGVRHLIMITSYRGLVESIVNDFRDELVDARIRELESELEYMRSLNNQYR